jgi:hypothetical protein
MLKIKNLHGECQHCGGPIEFHAEHVGSSAACPHCGEQTELLLAAPPEEKSPVPKKAIVFTVVAVLILAGGLVAANVALKRAKRLQVQRQPAAPVGPAKAPASTDPFAAQDFRVSAVTLEQGQGSALVYAVGTIQNAASRQRFGVKGELELLDSTGNKGGLASDYQKVIEPTAEWKFRALVVDKNARAAKVAAILEAR